jgi:hypothetical protein
VHELSFRGKDRYHPSWPHFGVLVIGLLVEGVFSFSRLGVVGFCWLLGATIALVGLGYCVVVRSWTGVGTAGITICWGIGRGRTYPWREIRWIDVRETNSRYGTALSARVTLTNGRRRALPALQDSTRYPDPEFRRNFRRVVDWWTSSTDPAERFQPPARRRYRLTPAAAGFIVGLLTVVVVIGVSLAVNG